MILSGDRITNLSSGGSVFIYFDRPIRADKQVVRLSLLDATRLYKLPKAYVTKYDSVGIIYDEKMIYNLHDFGNKGKKIFPNDKRLSNKDMNNIISNIKNDKNPYEVDKFKILEDLNRLDSGKEPLFMEEIPVGSVEIVNGNILRVTPRYGFEELNKYGLWVDKRVIEDLNRFNMEHNLKLTFWTRADNQNTVANWLDPNDTGAGGIYENIQASYKQYTLFGAPQYGPQKPMVLDPDREVIPNPMQAVIE